MNKLYSTGHIEVFQYGFFIFALIQFTQKSAFI